MPVFLGPLPEGLQEAIARWIEQDRRRWSTRSFRIVVAETIARWIGRGRGPDPPAVDPVVDALFIYGGPGGCCYLKASGEMLSWDAWEDVVTTMEDGPDKVAIIVFAAEHRTELARWLPVREPNAKDCQTCGAKGWLPPPWARVLCPDCSGPGWLPLESTST
jgi:hypothetical protein